MSEELDLLKKELWKAVQVIKKINAIAAERELDDEEKDKLEFLVKQVRSIQQEIKEEEKDSTK